MSLMGKVGTEVSVGLGGLEGLVALGLKLLSGAWPSRTVRWGSREPSLQRDKNRQVRCKWKNVHKEKYCVCWHVLEARACDLDYPGDGFQIHLLAVELTSPHDLSSDAVLCLWLPMSAAGEIVPWAVPHPSTTFLLYLFLSLQRPRRTLCMAASPHIWKKFSQCRVVCVGFGITATSS